MQLGLTDAAYRQPSVLIQNGDKTEVLWMTGQGYGKNADPKAASTSTTEELVTKAGPNKFIVAQSLIDQITADPEALTGKVRVSAHKGSDGQVDGFRLSGIRRRSFSSNWASRTETLSIRSTDNSSQTPMLQPTPIGPWDL